MQLPLRETGAFRAINRNAFGSGHGAATGLGLTTIGTSSLVGASATVLSRGDRFRFNHRRGRCCVRVMWRTTSCFGRNITASLDSSGTMAEFKKLEFLSSRAELGEVAGTNEFPLKSLELSLNHGKIHRRHVHQMFAVAMVKRLLASRKRRGALASG